MGNVLRLGAGLLIIVLLARRLGPDGFGVFAYGLAVASLAVMILNFGLSTAVLRRFGAEPERSLDALAEALTGKLLLLGPLLLLAFAGAALLPSPAGPVFLALLLAQAAESFSEVYQLAFRAASRFKDEAGRRRSPPCFMSASWPARPGPGPIPHFARWPSCCRAHWAWC